MLMEPLFVPGALLSAGDRAVKEKGKVPVLSLLH